MSEIQTISTLAMIYKKKSDNSVCDSRTKDSSINDSPIKKVIKKKVSYTSTLVKYIDIESFKKHNLDITNEPEEKKVTVKCHCIVF
jgi:hypothetical protein